MADPTKAANDLFSRISKFIDKDVIRTKVEDEFVDTGCVTINLLLSGKIKGGVPKSGVAMLAGDSGFGKTFVALSAAIEFMKQGYTVMWFDTEFAINETTIRNFGLQKYIDNHQFVLIGDMMIDTIKSSTVSIIDSIEKTDKLVIIIDSYAGLITNKNVDDALKEKDVVDLQTTKKKNEFMTIVNGLAAKKHVPVVVINHVYQEIGGMYPKTIISGGTKVRYFSNSIMLMSSKAKVKDKDGNIVGALVTAVADKSRFAKEQSRLKFYINYSQGLDRYFGMLDLLVDLEIIVKSGNRYMIPGDDKKYWEKDLYTPAVFEPILEAYQEKIESVFRYSKSEGDVDFMEEDGSIIESLDEAIDE
jgi:RecA/RadA recombinase